MKVPVSQLFARARSPRTPAPTIEFQIEELVLEGFPPEQRYAVRDSLERELARGLAQSQGATVGAARAVERLDLGAVTLGSSHSPAEVGRRVAQAIIGGLHQ